MSITRTNDGLPSESQSPRVVPNENDKGKQPLEQPVPQPTTSTPPIEETRPLKRIRIPHSHDGLSSESQSRVVIPNVDDKGKKPLEEPHMSEGLTCEPPSGETRHRQECRRQFEVLIGHDADYKTSAIEARRLWPLLTDLGLPPALTEDKLHDMLKLSGYSDEDGITDFERFTVFAEDLKVIESLRHSYVVAAMVPQYFDIRGPLGEFFAILDAADASEFVSYDFIDAFDFFGMKLTDENVDSLVRYANLPTNDEIPFDEFLKMLCREDEECMQGTGQRTVSRRMDALDKGNRVGRLMAFVSAYTFTFLLNV